MRALFALIAALSLASPAAAAWNVAKSTHFVIYANEKAPDLKDFATKLERFDQAARLAMAADDPKVGNGNRLTVFVLPAPADVRAIRGEKNGWLAGFYTGRISGSLAYVPRRMENPLFDPDTIFFHEYTHHLMMQALDRPYPEWYVEGFAEFLSTAKVEKDGTVWFGAPLQQRARVLLTGDPVPFQMLAGGIKPSFTNEQRNAFYGRGWLLAHYLQLSLNRQGQLQAYLDALAKGMAPLAAAQQIFGDLRQLDKELDRYRTQRLLGVRIPGSKIHIGSIDVQPLSPGSAAIILDRARIKFSKAYATDALVAHVRQVEGTSPGDELVETTLAEAELNAGDAEAAEAAADHALKTNPRNVEALLFKARAMEERAAAEPRAARHAAFEQARHFIVTANKLDTEDPEPLFEYYRSFLKEGVRPSDNAMAALHYASDLAPQDLATRMNSAAAYLVEGKLPEARATLAIVAYSPHDNAMIEVAKRMIADIDAGNGQAALLEARVRPPLKTP